MPPDTALPSGARHPLRNLWRVRTYVRPYLGQMVTMLVAAALGVGASIVVPLVTRAVIDGPVRRGETSGLLLLGGLALGLGVAEALCAFIRRWVQSGAAVGMEAAIRNDLYRHLLRLPVAFHDRWQTGQLVARITTDLGVIRRFLAFGLIFLVINIATYLTVVALLLDLYWPLGLLVAAGAAPLVWLSQRMEREYIVLARRVQDQQGGIADFVEESAVGFRTVKAFGRRREVLARFSGGAEALHDTAVAKARLIARFWASFDAVPNAMLAIVLLLGALAVARGSLSLGSLVAFVALMLMLVWPVDALGWILANGQEAATAADRLYEVLDTEPSILDRPDAVDATDVRGHLRLENVSFTYPDATEPVLHGIDLDIRPGETLALVGVTGSGKTTLTALVPRLYDVTGGRITLDGRDIRDLRLSSLRSVVSTAFE
ncbi:MAG TPA: ABC transporter ATP-binding protein, partial [Cryptosporangiaceae bacterium]|nr:ABC transporter ATP-binding protein [Cryptosporangiaceae bacterium]